MTADEERNKDGLTLAEWASEYEWALERDAYIPSEEEYYEAWKAGENPHNWGPRGRA